MRSTDGGAHGRGWGEQGETVLGLRQLPEVQDGDTSLIVFLEGEVKGTKEKTI